MTVAPPAHSGAAECGRDDHPPPLWEPVEVPAARGSSTAAGASEQGEPQSASRRTVAVWLAMAVLTGLLVGAAALGATQLSILDEQTHADYAWRIVHGELPAAGSVIAPEILAEYSCRGASTEAMLPPCGDDGPPSAYPFRGEDYNFWHPPVYYAITGVLAAAADAVLPGDHFFALARLTGVLWLWAGMGVLYLAVRRFGAPRAHATLAAAGLPLSPGVLSATSNITNDAPAVLGGAVALYCLVRLLRDEPLGWPVLGAAAGAVTATKVLNGVPFGVLAMVCVGLAVARHREGDRAAVRSLVAAAVAIVAAMLAVYLGWVALQSGRGVDGWVNPLSQRHGRDVVGLPFDEWLPTVVNGLSLQYPYVMTPAIDGALLRIWARAFGVVLLLAAPMAIVTTGRWTPQWVLGVATTAGLLTYPVLVQLQVLISDDQFWPSLSTRYGMAFVPWVLLCLVLVAWRRSSRFLLPVGALIGSAVVIGAVAGAL